MKLTSQDKKFLAYLGILVSLYILPIILADFYFLDDIQRSIKGSYTWVIDGRLLGSLVYYILNFFSPKVLDFAPLYQIFGGIFLCLSGYIIYKIFRIFKEVKPYISAMVVFIFIANPFFLENLSYKYDSLTMCISIFVGCLSYYFFFLKRYFFSFLLYTSVWFVYQPSITLILSLYIIGVSLNQDKNTPFTIKEMIVILVSSIFSFLIFKVISSFFISGWAASHQSIISFNLEGIRIFIRNITQSFVFISKFFSDKTTWIVFTIPAIILYIWYLIKSQVDKKGTLSIFHISLKIFSPIILLLITLIPIMFLVHPVIVHRVFIGFSSVLLLFTLLSLFLLRNKSIYYIIFPCFYLMVLSYTYANAQKVHSESENEIVQYLIEDLKSANKISSVKHIVFHNNEPIPSALDTIYFSKNLS